MTSSPLLSLPNTYRAFYGSFPYLYPIQKQAIAPLLEGRDLVLQSATGSGKTEAVLAPCLERVIQAGREQAVVYVVPTRALAVDLERRLGVILNERLGMRIGVRTGDLKRAGGARPDVVLTTPESLDVMLGSPNAEVRRFAQRVATVVIDEAHPLLHHYRGQQLSYLLRRLERRVGGGVQKVALSATIADVDSVIRFFGFREDAVRLIEPVQRGIVPHLVQLRQDEQELVALLDDLYETWGYRKVLVFANSRGACDRLFSVLDGQGCFRGVAELHYSNLKSKARRGAEGRFRRREHALCIATSTLELGIDIGDVDGVVLYEPPDSVSAFLQRIGRANRREEDTHFWGICRGERVEAQVLRFLGLLRLARQGVVERLQPRDYPSVLAQQALSCLYEKKRISLRALQDLFPQQQETLEGVFESMAQKGWLRRERTGGLYRGSRRYRDDFLERRIWSNFPPAEEDYVLELSGEAVADLPRSIVRQLDAGDRVQLAGKRLQVVKIEAGEHRRVAARPADRLDEKELFWLGPGFRVSYEVAQGIREVIRAPVDEQASGLFSRTRRLLAAAQARAGRVVALDNGIEVGRSAGGLYRYRTYLGSVGNLMLQWHIEDVLGARVKDLAAASDEVGVDCSHWVDFRALDLPVDREGVHAWAEGRLEALCALFPLNAFCAALPHDLLVEEVAAFLFDERVAEAFRRYSIRSSDVVSGDLAVLDQEAQEAEQDRTVWLDVAPGAAPLLAWEKRRWGVDDAASGFAFGPDARYRPRALTGTMAGGYTRHRQCERWLGLQFLPPEQRPPGWQETETEMAALRMEAGRRHESRALDGVRDQADELVVVEDVDVDGRRRSLRDRFEMSLTLLGDRIREVESNPDQSFALSQAVLIVPSVVGEADGWLARVDGVGIPDLIRVYADGGRVVLEVGDIKDSRAAYDSQKWQVAFYARLLETLIAGGALSARAEVSATGVLMLRPPPGDEAPERHAFDLQPYMTAFPMLLRNAGEALARTPGEAAYRLQPHCTTCPNFAACYREALGREDVLFLPQLSAGALEKFRILGITRLEESGAWFDQASPEGDPFSPHQRAQLAGRLTAMRTNRIGLRERKTRLFPENLSTAIFLHLIEDPITGLPRAVGWRALRGDAAVDQRTWVVASEDELPETLQEFFEDFMSLWEGGIEGGLGPHVFHFGERVWQALQVWAGSGKGEGLGFLWAAGRRHHTDLRRLVGAHFDVPIPGVLTLFGLGRALGLRPELGEPESFFHGDDLPYVSPEAWAQDEAVRRETGEYLHAALELELEVWRWVAPHLESAWTQRDWRPGAETTQETAYTDFLEEEKRLREEDVLALQAYTLTERVARFRAVGPLKFAEMALDEEGRFVYGFQADAEAGLSRFREGDFLKLAAVGTADLQGGLPVILVGYDRRAGQVWVQSRQGRLGLNRQVVYSLEEDLTDWNGPKLLHAVRAVFSPDRSHRLAGLFSGEWDGAQDPDALRWAQRWLAVYGPISGLNPTQQAALTHPFRRRLSLIEGPPGTGKTHLLGWTLIALVQRAQEMGMPLRIAVSALTHQAIDHVLRKVVSLVVQHGLQDFPGRCLKWGRWEADADAPEDVRVAPLENAEDLEATRYAVVGATGFGLYQMFEGRRGIFPQVFDWVVFDEASQVLVPQALLSLLYGKGNLLFTGDVKQLPPVVLGDYKEGMDAGFGVQRSVLSQLLDACGPSHGIRLDWTYRMNRELCAFPSGMWYDGALRPAPGNADGRLALCGFQSEDALDRVIDPDKPVSLLVVDHRGCHQKSDAEAEVVAEIAHRLMTRYGLTADRLALISPHRAQNNATADRLTRLFGDADTPLPLIDTVERVQGAERDVILFAFTTSDPDYITSEFLSNPNRFNVAITRAKKKLIVVGSRAFFTAVPHTEDALKANRCFKAFYAFCKERNGIFFA